ncbi:MAG: BamA/TamA family outer membrane protein [candidate division WOR-3 bacterium]
MLNILSIITILVAVPSQESLNVRKIYFQGNRSVKSSVLTRLLTTKVKEPFYPITLQNDVENIINLYHNQGFWQTKLDTKIISTTKGKNVYFLINEGPRIKISAINFSGVENFTLSKIKSIVKIKVGDYLISNNIKQTEKQITQHYQNNGYPFINIQTDIETLNYLAVVNFHIIEGQLVFIKSLLFRGNHNLSTHLMQQIIEIKKGEKFSLTKLEKSRQNLYASRLFERVLYYIIDTNTKDSVIIRFDVLELPPRSVGFGAGIQTPPAALLLSAEWQHHNLWRKRHNLFVSLNFTPAFSGNFENQFKSTYRIYHFLTTPINFVFQPSFRFEKKDSVKQNELRIDAGISHYIETKLELGTFIKYLRATSNLADTSSNPKQSITNSQNIYLSLDTRDNLFRPTSGIFLTTNFQWAGKILGGDNDFFKNQTEFILFKKILPQLVFGVRSLFGFVIPYGRSDVVPYYEAFSLGGNNGLRGYDDKAIGPLTISDYHYGDAIINTNFELRTKTDKIIDLVIFFDGGKVTNQDELFNFNSELLHYSGGIGIRINTPLGPLRIDYAKRLKDPASGDWGKIHLGLLNIF